MKHIVLFISIIVFIETLSGQTKPPRGFVDMGIRANNGDVLYWSNADFNLAKNGAYSFSNKYEPGSVASWSDVKKIIESQLSDKLEMNISIDSTAGNEKYDILRLKLGNPYRLPTEDEIRRLCNNTTMDILTFNRKLPEIDKRGVPTWIYGQWLWQPLFIIDNFYTIYLRQFNIH